VTGQSHGRWATDSFTIGDNRDHHRRQDRVRGERLAQSRRPQGGRLRFRRGRQSRADGSLAGRRGEEIHARRCSRCRRCDRIRADGMTSIEMPPRGGISIWWGGVTQAARGDAAREGRSCRERPSRNVAEHVLIGQIACSCRVGHRFAAQSPESLDGKFGGRSASRATSLLLRPVRLARRASSRSRFSSKRIVRVPIDTSSGSVRHCTQASEHDNFQVSRLCHPRTLERLRRNWGLIEVPDRVGL